MEQHISGCSTTKISIKEAPSFSTGDEEKRKATSVVSLKSTREDDLEAKGLHYLDETRSQAINFNLQSYFPDCESHDGGPSLRLKAILAKQACSRTKAEVDMVRRFLMTLNNFRRYSSYVCSELARVIFYEVMEKRQVAIQQGYLVFDFYFILSGSVLVEAREKDPISGAIRNNVVREMGPGSTFGELAILHNDKQEATIICKEDCEFLKVNKDDFNAILRTNCEQEWSRRKSVILDHPLFSKGWDKNTIKLAVEGSQFVEFMANSVVLKDLSKMAHSVYIITRGNCQVVQKVCLLESRVYFKNGKSKPHFSLPSVSNSKEEGYDGERAQRVQKWWSIRVLQPGDYFGIGEGKSGTSVICLDTAECLLINSITFVRHSQGRFLEKMRAEAKELYPSTEVAFENFKLTSMWNEYKKGLVQDIIAKKLRKLQKL